MFYAGMSMPTAIAEELNSEQLQAATHGTGPLLIVAGAGTGKTKTLAWRVAHLIESGISPERILLLTFSRRAAREMLTRAAQIVGESQTARVWSGTFHSVANRVLRTYGGALGLPPQFTVMDQADAADLMNLLRDDLGLAKGPRRFPRKDTLIEIYSRVINTRRKLSDVILADYPWCEEEVEGLRAIFRDYMLRKREQGLLDYDDLLVYCQGLTQIDQVAETLGNLWDHVLVDEYQDTNVLQADILLGLRKTNPNITVVGDDAQSIYSFRAADVRNILDFPKHFTGATVVTLEQNYRSTQPILRVANAVIAKASERYTKNLWSKRDGDEPPVLAQCLDEAQQAEAVSRQVLELREQGLSLKDQAVLYRSGHHSDLLQIELARRNIPFVVYGGLKFIEAAHIKDLLACLRILENPRDELSWFRVLQLLKGVGPSHARKLMDGLGVRTDQTSAPTGQPARQASPLERLMSAPPPTVPEAVEEFASLVRALADCERLPPGAQVERLRLFYEPIFERVYTNSAVRLRDLEQLEQLASRYQSRREFISDLTLDPPASTSDLAGPPHLDEDYLILSTVHSAKGCEWKAVHIIHAADGAFPSDMSTRNQQEVDEERRLFYVALTRAKDSLWIYWPLRYYHRRTGRGDAHSFAQVSRFLAPEVRGLMEQKALYDEQDSAPTPVRQQAVAIIDNLFQGLLD